MLSRWLWRYNMIPSAHGGNSHFFYSGHAPTSICTNYRFLSTVNHQAYLLKVAWELPSGLGLWGTLKERSCVFWFRYVHSIGTPTVDSCSAREMEGSSSFRFKNHVDNYREEAECSVKSVCCYFRLNMASFQKCLMWVPYPYFPWVIT